MPDPEPDVDRCRCPDCGSPLQIDPTAIIVQRVPWPYQVKWREFREVSRLAPVAFCTGCEFAIEIRPVTTAG